MNPRSSRASWALAPLFAAAAAVGQVPTTTFGLDAIDGAPQALAMTPVPLHQPHGDLDAPTGDDLAVWAAGLDYKVSFAGDGVATFVPYLGRGYPHNQPFAWRTVAVTAGGESLLEATLPVERSYSAQRLVYRRGGVLEVYDVLDAGLEQSFVITARPGRAGALAVVGELTTQLHTAPRASQHGALTFVDADGQAILSYGAATAIDAAGARCEIATAFADGRITLTVPATFVAAAQFPLTIDPLVSANGYTLTDGADGRVAQNDVVRNSATDRIAAGYTRWASAADADCWVREWNDSFGQGTYALLYTDLQTAWSTEEVAMACAGSPERYCFAITREFADGTIRVRAHLHDCGDQTLSTTVIGLANTSGHLNRNIDVGGTDSNIDSRQFLVVWQNDADVVATNSSNIHAATIEAATGVPSPFVVIDGAGDFELPNVNQVENAHATLPTTWMVVWERRGGTSPRDLAMARVASDHTVTLPYFLAISGQHHIQPRVAGANGRYALLYATATTAQLSATSPALTGWGLQARRVNWPIAGAVEVFPMTVIKDHAATNNGRWRTGSIAYDRNTRSHWALGYLHDPAPGGARNAYVARVGYRGRLLEGDVLVHDGSAWHALPPALTFDAEGDRFPLVYSANNATGYVMGNFLVPPSAAPWIVDGASCTSATIAWTGDGNNQQLGSEFTFVEMDNMPLNSLSFVGLSLVPQDAILMHPAIQSGCRLHIDIGAGFVGIIGPAVGSSALRRVVLPETLPPMTLYCQGWYFEHGTGLLRSTSRLEVPLVK